MFDFNPSAAQNDLQALRIAANGVAQYCNHIVLTDGTDGTAEALSDADHNAQCFTQIRAGILMLTSIIDRAGLTSV